MKFIKEKRELLVIELFISKVKASDILPDIPIIITYYIDFPFIITENIRKTIIETSNTVLGIDEILIIILQIV